MKTKPYRPACRTHATHPHRAKGYNSSWKEPYLGWERGMSELGSEERKTGRGLLLSPEKRDLANIL